MRITRSRTFVDASIKLSLAMLLLLVVSLSGGTAFAHAKVANSTPASNASVAAGLTQILIVFTEEISVDQSSAQVVGPDGKEITGVTMAVNRAKRKEMTIKTPPLNAAGQYQVKWKAVTEEDNGITNGTLNFSVGGSVQNCVTFKETGKTACGVFLQYWNSHGGLPQQGFPISAEMEEKSDTDGKSYTVQYFERAVFEKHPENGPPNDVLLSLLGNFLYKQKYPGASGAADQKPNTSSGSVLFSQTGKRLGGRFLQYWQQNGGLAQQGYPISDEFQEKSALDGKTYKVQYFERAVFELHSENEPPYDVLLSQLGTFRYEGRMGNRE